MHKASAAATHALATRKRLTAAHASHAAIPAHLHSRRIDHTARRLRLLAFGSGKSEVLRRVLTAPVGPEVPGTFLRGHPDFELWVDGAAARGLEDLLPEE